MTQTFIFVNTLDFAEKIHKLLRKEGFASYIMFSKMQKEERDATIQKFRNQEINVLITTNLIARGIDVPEVELVINYDVPAKKV
jgi:superfamily II DNA/RNA helicase